MGGPMAANLIKAGFEVTVHNRTRSREDALEALGAARAASPAEAAHDASRSCWSVSRIRRTWSGYCSTQRPARATAYAKAVW